MSSDLGACVLEPLASASQEPAGAALLHAQRTGHAGRAELRGQAHEQTVALAPQLRPLARERQMLGDPRPGLGTRIERPPGALARGPMLIHVLPSIAEAPDGTGRIRPDAQRRPRGRGRAVAGVRLRAPTGLVEIHSETTCVPLLSTTRTESISRAPRAGRESPL